MMAASSFPQFIPNWIAGSECNAEAMESFDKVSPHDGTFLSKAVRSRAADVNRAVAAAGEAQKSWGQLPAARRGMVLHEFAMQMTAARNEIAAIIAAETGKSYKLALGETDGAISLALFMAGEGQRLYGRTTTSAVANKWAMTIRQPLGVAGHITAANTPIANVAWKVFPALICGNAAVLKPAEDAPATAWILGRLAHAAGIPPGVLNIIQGYGPEAGAALVEHPDVAVISFTGSTSVGREIAAVAGRRMARLSLELGGKNPLVVCDDADLSNAVYWTLLSAFSNAGQRCASASRVIVFDSVYDEFKTQLVERTSALRIGPTDDDDLGPVINQRQVTNIVGAINRARAGGAVVLSGGARLTGNQYESGFYVAPTLIENVSADHELSCTELFGPVAVLYRVPDFAAALELANRSPYGLTACIHTRNFHRAMEFVQRVEAGVAVVNGGTYGSEPHMPFGGVKQSGNGSREPGTEALDIYSNLKDVYLNHRPDEL
jgi:aldehyde dehydrogenase (NAD+)